MESFKSHVLLLLLHVYIPSCFLVCPRDLVRDSTTGKQYIVLGVKFPRLRVSL